MKSVLVATVLVVAACGVQTSGIDPNASVTVSGTATASNGMPLANTKVILVKELDFGETVGGLFVTAVTLGIACLADHPPALCANDSHAATTDSTGSYSFSIKGSETIGSLGTASTMEVVARGARTSMEISGPTSLAEFTVQTTSVTLPDLRIWRPNLSFGYDGSAGWSALPAAYGDAPSYSVEISDLHGNQWWVTGAMNSGDRFDDRVLEDLHGGADVTARAHGTGQGTTVAFTYVSESLPMRGSSGPPPSRGAPCAPVTSSGVGHFESACALTSINSGNHLPATFAAATGVVIDLGMERALSLVVAKGCASPCSITLSSDLASWSEAGTLSGEYATAPVTLNRSARYVRINGSPNVSGLLHLSVW